MAQYDSLLESIGRCLGNPTFNALQAVGLLERAHEVITALQDTVRHYNADDAIFDDEKTRR